MVRPLPVLLALLLVLAPLQGCLSGNPFDGGEDTTNGGTDGGDGGTDGDDGGSNGTDGSDGDDGQPPPPLPKPDFVGERAYAHVADQVSFDRNGTRQYRIPGTLGAKQARRDIVEVLSRHNWNPYVQRWKGTYVCEETTLVNVVGTMQGRTNRQIILGAHYDTRPWSDQDDNFSRRGEPTPGANDGGSGVGALLELGRVLQEERPLNYTVKLVFFDAEDGGSPPPLQSDCKPSEHEGHKTPGGWIIGSSHYVAEMSEQARNRTDAVIILDLVGGENLTLMKERRSVRNAGDLHGRIWKQAAALNYTQFKNETGPRILDDHAPFQRVGIPAVDVIHLDENGSTPFPATWHATNDTLEHVSPRSLEAVGRVTERAIYSLDRALGNPN